MTDPIICHSHLVIFSANGKGCHPLLCSFDEACVSIKSTAGIRSVFGSGFRMWALFLGALRWIFGINLNSFSSVNRLGQAHHAKKSPQWIIPTRPIVFCPGAKFSFCAHSVTPLSADFSTDVHASEKEYLMSYPLNNHPLLLEIH